MKTTDFNLGYIHGRTGQDSNILEDQTLEYYEGVAKGMQEYYFINPHNSHWE